MKKIKKHLIEMRKEYKNIMRNLWNPFDKNFESVIGCNTVNRVYITPIGDVLSCPYVHIKIGNVYDNTLKEISEHGFSFKRFRENSQACLAGEDQGFVKNFMSKKGTSIFKPVDAKEVFPEDHYTKFSFND
jgi:MoaA/NifB/PqqE/SkfB family radical SAM enzyme